MIGGALRGIETPKSDRLICWATDRAIWVSISEVQRPRIIFLELSLLLTVHECNPSVGTNFGKLG